MTLTCLIPNIFYDDVKVGLDLFVRGLGFSVYYEDLSSPEGPWYILGKDTLKVHLIQNAEFAKKDRPELRLETDNIEELYDRIKNECPDLFHPNCKEIKTQPWGARSFGVIDASDVCIVISQ